eukprot:127071-Alexandrium_andersonii.AAC.1
MSASLVGSEMCIRDSHSTIHNNIGIRLLPILPLLGFQLLKNDVGFRAPVSYTHLTLPTICSV